MPEAHYRFPPASAYGLNRLLFQVKSDRESREKYVRDPEALMRDAGLSADERAALRAADRDALVRLGAHPYLVFMADLRLKMDRGNDECF